MKHSQVSSNVHFDLILEIYEKMKQTPEEKNSVIEKKESSSTSTSQSVDKKSSANVSK